jgi:hypothetical protein
MWGAEALVPPPLALLGWGLQSGDPVPESEQRGRCHSGGGVCRWRARVSGDEELCRSGLLSRQGPEGRKSVSASS